MLLYVQTRCVGIRCIVCVLYIVCILCVLYNYILSYDICEHILFTIQQTYYIQYKHITIYTSLYVLIRAYMHKHLFSFYDNITRSELCQILSPKFRTKIHPKYIYHKHYKIHYNFQYYISYLYMMYVIVYQCYYIHQTKITDIFSYNH